MLVAVPPEVVTLIGPVAAPAGTVASIAVAELTVNAALTLLNRTAVAPLKLVPLFVRGVPRAPLGGGDLGAVGAIIENGVPRAPVPPVVVTVIGPVVPPAGTVPWFAVAEFPVNVARVLLN